MHTTAARTARLTGQAARHHHRDRTPNPVASAIFCLAIFAGGLLGAQQWLADVCPTTPQLAQVCTAADGVLS